MTNGEYFADGTTGRFLVLLDESAGKAAIAAVSEASVSETGPEVFDELGVVVVDAPPEQIAAAAEDAGESSMILAVEPERVVRALETASYSRDYLQGYRDAVLHLTTERAGVGAGAAAPVLAAVEESQATWGLQAVKAVSSCRSGREVGVAVLDTGMDLDHPDFDGRNITSRSFVAGQEVQDLNSHGTHCIGTALGSKCPATRPRYGVAYEGDVFAGKVLSNAGSGSDGQILAGINWAVANGCAVISMSLGARMQPGQRYSAVFEAVARRASNAGSLILAAAGNDSRRPNPPAPVSHPANCPSILAVAALDQNLGIASFSNRGINPDGGQIDVAGPGVDVYSSVPRPQRHGRKSGTSMATPHAAGVAALHAEANPEARGSELGQILTATARRLTALPSADVGAGLVQAP